VFVPSELLADAKQGLDLDGIDVSLYDLSAPVGERILVRGALAEDPDRSDLPEEQRIKAPTSFSWSAPLDVAGRQWELRLLPTPAYLASHLPDNGWLILTAGLLFTSLVGAFTMVVTGRDVAFRRLVEERTQELRDNETRMRTIVDAVVDGIVTIDIYGNIDTLNPAAERIFGYDRGEVTGLPFTRLIERSSHEQIEGFFDSYRHTGYADGLGRMRELEGRRRDGSEFPVEIALSDMEVMGQRKFIAIFRDITERKQVERLKMEFVSTVSHELRTPLTSIRGSLGLVASGTLGKLPGRVQDMVDLAHKNTTRLIKLVNDILDLEKFQSDGLEFEDAEISLRELIHAAVQENRGYGAELDVRFVIVGEIPEVNLRGDGLRLSQALANLLSNAAKFSPRGDQVEISAEREDYVVRIAVADHGEGIPEEARATIFDRFTQADSSDTRRKGGTGLGLNITRSIVERHGGYISFDSEVGKGTTFYIDLPISVRGEAEAPAPTLPVPAETGARVLVCDEDFSVASSIAGLLSKAGYQTEIARNAAEVKQRLASARFQVLAVDISLPDQDAISLIRDVRRLDGGQDLAVVVMSARAEQTREEVICSVMGVVDWVDKPLEGGVLLAAVGRAARLGRGLRRPGGRSKILYVEDDHDLAAVVSVLLRRDFDVTRTATRGEAEAKLRSDSFDLVVLDVALPDGSGLDLLPLIEERGGHNLPVIIFSGLELGARVADRVEAVLVKSHTSNEDLLGVIRSVVATHASPLPN
jgi:PAS domain S-box-containing protein